MNRKPKTKATPTKQPLTIKKEKIRSLTTQDLQEVVGGTAIPKHAQRN